MAGRGGLNLTHSEDLEEFLSRYGAAEPGCGRRSKRSRRRRCAPLPKSLGQKTFVGSSGRVFPVALKASPLLRAWLARLAAQGVQLRPAPAMDRLGRRRATRIPPPRRRERDRGARRHRARARRRQLAKARRGRRLGRDPARGGVEIAPLQPANCGFAVAWSEPFRRALRRRAAEERRAVLRRAHVRGEAVVDGLRHRGRRGLCAVGPAARRHRGRRASESRRSTCAPICRRSGSRRGSRSRAPARSLANACARRPVSAPLAINLLRESARTALPRDAGQRSRPSIKNVPLRVRRAAGPRPRHLHGRRHRGDGVRPKLHAARRAGRRSSPARCSTGRRRPAATCCRRAFRTGAAAARGVLAWLAETGRMPRREPMPADSFLH